MNRDDSGKIHSSATKVLNCLKHLWANHGGYWAWLNL